MTEGIDIQKHADVDQTLDLIEQLAVRRKKIQHPRQCGAPERSGIREQTLKLREGPAWDAGVEVISRIPADSVDTIPAAVAVVGDAVLPDGLKLRDRFVGAALVHRHH